MDIMTAIAAATNAVELLKGLNQIDREYDKAELKAKVAELLSSVADLKVTLIEAGEDIAGRDAEIDRLKNAFMLRGETVRQSEFAYDKDEKGRPVGHPYCPRCEQVDGFFIKVVAAEGARGNMLCPRCKTNYVHVGVYRHEAG